MRNAARSAAILASNCGVDRDDPQCVGWSKPFWMSMRRSPVSAGRYLGAIVLEDVDDSVPVTGSGDLLCD